MARLSHAVLGTILVLIPAAVPAAEGADPSLASIAAGEADRRFAPEALAEGPGGVLAAMAGLDRFPVACATPILLAPRTDDASSDPLRKALANIAGLRDDPSERSLLTRDGRFIVHVSARAGLDAAPDAGAGRNGGPDIVQRVAESLVASRSYLVATLGYPEPGVQGEPLAVHLVRLGHGLEGLTIPARFVEGQAQPLILLDAGLAADRTLGAVMHQVAHASLLSFAARSAPWWAESTSSYLTLAATGDLEEARPGLRARLQSQGRGLTADGLALMQGTLLWPLFLTERTGDIGVVRQIWEEMAAQGIDPLAAADRVLRRAAGVGLLDMFREQAAWNLFTAGRDDGRHYSFARVLPEAPLPAVGPDLPFRIGPIEPVEPLGSVSFRIPSDGREGSIVLEVNADGGRPAADLLVSYRDSGGQPLLVPVPLDSRGTGSVSLPWGDAREAWLILRNASAEAGAGPVRFEVRAAHDPLAPYDLASFTAQAVGPSILLEWTTASESGLVAWNVYRSEKPTGPFARLNVVAVPAYGDGTTDTGYIFVDDRAAAGRRYYYRIEGITRLGLVQRSHLVSGRSRSGR